MTIRTVQQGVLVFGLVLTISGCGGADLGGGSPETSSGDGGGALGSGGSAAIPMATRGELTVLSTAPKYTSSLATYVRNVYFTDFYGVSNDGSVYGVDARGVELFRVDGMNFPGGIAANAGGVYWAGEPNLSHANLDGSNITVLSAGFIQTSIALGPNGLYGSGSNGSSGGIVHIGLSGGPTVSLTSDLSIGVAYGIAADADNVYWMVDGDPMSIRSVPLAGGSAVKQIPPAGKSKQLASSPGPGKGMAIDALSVYWLDHDGTVMKVPLGGGPPVPLAFGTPCDSLAGCIAVDGTNVYWSTADSIMKVSVAGGAPELLASGQSSPGPIAVDDTSVYWANLRTSTGLDHGTILRLTPK